MKNKKWLIAGLTGLLLLLPSCKKEIPLEEKIQEAENYRNSNKTEVADTFGMDYSVFEYEGKIIDCVTGENYWFNSMSIPDSVHETRYLLTITKPDKTREDGERTIMFEDSYGGDLIIDGFYFKDEKGNFHRYISPERSKREIRDFYVRAANDPVWQDIGFPVIGEAALRMGSILNKKEIDERLLNEFEMGTKLRIHRMQLKNQFKCDTPQQKVLDALD